MSSGEFNAIIAEMLSKNVSRDEAARRVAELARSRGGSRPASATRVYSGPAGPRAVASEPSRRDRDELVRIAGAVVVGESDLALRVVVQVRTRSSTESRPVYGWVPRRYIPAEDRAVWERGHRGTLAVPRWLAVERGWAEWP